MNKQLTSLEVLAEFLYTEIKRATVDPDLSDKAYAYLKEAVIQAIDLKRKVELARAYAYMEERNQSRSSSPRVGCLNSPKRL